MNLYIKIIVGSFVFAGLLAGLVFFLKSNEKVDYVALVEGLDPKAAMEVLAGELEKNPALVNTCHGITHDIGHAAFEKYGFEKSLMDFEDDICGSGYMHGVIEEYIEGAEDPLSVMLSACPADYGACFHGIGHGLLLFFKYNIEKATAGCDLFEEVSERVACSEGVFMQNFAADTGGQEDAKLDPKNPLFPCNLQSDLHKSACYFYAPRYFLTLHSRDYDEAVNLCLNSAEEEYVGRCVRGVGSVAMKQNIDNVKFVEKVCGSAPEEYQIDCYGGLVGYFVIHSGSTEKAAKLCPRLKEDFQTVCRGTVKGSEGFFRD